MPLQVKPVPQDLIQRRPGESLLATEGKVPAPQFPTSGLCHGTETVACKNASFPTRKFVRTGSDQKKSR